MQRWNIQTEVTAETGSDIGSNLIITRFADAGNAPKATVRINRNDGLVSLLTNTMSVFRDPTTAMEVTTKQYVDANDAMDLPLTGGTLSGGLSFGSATAGNANDLSRHIALYGANFGFCITSSRINYIVPATNFHAFRSGNADRVIITDGGITMSAGTAVILNADPTANLHAVTKQYVDTNNARYLQLTGGTITGGLTVKGNTFLELGTTYGTATGSGNSSRLIMNAAMGTGPGFAFKIANVTRWNIILNNGAESGNDAGGDICFYAYHDDGSFIGTPLNIRRSDGYTQFSSTIKVGRDPTIALEVTTKQYVDTNNAKYLLLTGGTLTNFLTLNAAPTSNLHAATKQYVDDLIVAGQSGVATFNGRNGAVTLIKGDVDSAGGPYMPSSGGAFSGGISFGAVAVTGTDLSKHIQLHANGFGLNITSGALNLISNSNVIVAISSSGLAMTSGKMLTLTADPTSALHAATKQYVDTKQPLGGPYLPLTSGTLTGGLAFQTPIASAVDDLSKQLSFAVGYGFSITAGRLNLVSAGTIGFYVGGADRSHFLCRTNRFNRADFSSR